MEQNKFPWAESKQTWYMKIAEVILSTITFDVSTNTDGLKTVDQMIAKKMCEGFSFAQTVAVYPYYCEMVKRNKAHAIYHIVNSLKQNVYRRIEGQQEIISDNGTSRIKGGKFVEYLTLDVNYRDAREAEIERIAATMRKTLVSSKRTLERIAPRRDFDVLVSKELKQLG